MDITWSVCRPQLLCSGMVPAFVFLLWPCAVLIHSVVSNSLWPHGLQAARLLCPWKFSREEYWSGLPCPPSGDLLNPGIKPRSSALQGDSDPPGKPKNTGVGSLSLLQGIFPTQELNQGLLHCRWILYQLSYQGSPNWALGNQNYEGKWGREVFSSWGGGHWGSSYCRAVTKMMSLSENVSTER